MLKKILPIMAIILCLTTQAFSQGNKDLLVQEVKNAYTQLRYTEAEIKARTVLAAYQNFSPDQLSETHKILGLIYYSQNKISESGEQFVSALSIDPLLKLDPVLVSPKILKFFEKVKTDFESKRQEKILNQPKVRYIRLTDPRPDAIVRSMIIPGWGQVYKGEKTKGRFLMAAWGVTFVGAVGSHLARKSAEDKYISETNPDLVKSKFDDFNKWHVARNNFAIAATGIWLYSYFDAIFRKNSHHQPVMGESKQSFNISPIFSADRTFVQLNVHF